MKLGAFSAGWLLLDGEEIEAMGLDKTFRWEAFALGVSGRTHFNGVLFLVRPIVARLSA